MVAKKITPNVPIYEVQIQHDNGLTETFGTTEEQVLVQPIYDKYAGTKAMQIYENAVRQKGTVLPDNYNLDRLGAKRLGMAPFTEKDLNNLKDRWAYAMKQMGYKNIKPEMMPRVKR